MELSEEINCFPDKWFQECLLLERFTILRQVLFFGKKAFSIAPFY
jgi:hypothetical protein